MPRSGGTDLVFASQAIVPRERSDRMRVARLLVAAARADPSKRVVVKERAASGEHQTHAQRYGYPGLLRTLAPLPENLVVSTEPMSHALDRAEGLVTVSSTAAIEAVARGIPVIALDSFGVDDKLINPVFVGSGLFGSEEDVIGRQFRLPPREWLARQLLPRFRSRTTGSRQVDELVALRRAGALPPKPARERRGGRVRDVWERKLALGRNDRSLAGAVVYVIVVPLRLVLRPILRPYYRRSPEPESHAALGWAHDGRGGYVRSRSRGVGGCRSRRHDLHPDVLDALGAQQMRRYASLTGAAAQRFLVGRAMLADLIADLTDLRRPAASRSTCDRCGADHGRPRLERAPIAVSVSYAGQHGRRRGGPARGCRGGGRRHRAGAERRRTTAADRSGGTVSHPSVPPTSRGGRSSRPR